MEREEYSIFSDGCAFWEGAPIVFFFFFSPGNQQDTSQYRGVPFLGRAQVTLLKRVQMTHVLFPVLPRRHI